MPLPAADAPVTWVAYAASPSPVDETMDARDSALLARCGAGEQGLRSVAQRLAARRAAEGAKGSGVDLDAVAFAQRAAGEPHVWPRAWVVTGHAPIDGAWLASKLDAWAASFHDVGQRRCGVARAAAADGAEVVAVVAVDALADLAPLPTRTHAGTWLTVDARVFVNASDAQVVVVGPGGEPRRLVAWTRGDHLVARFAPERAGDFTVQIVADVGTGPRPILEARVFADVAPPERFEAPRAPGEEEPTQADDDDTAVLARMVAGLRSDARLPPLARDARLDALALAHVRRMMAARTVGHDVGDGAPSDRAIAAGVHARAIGENVAHAADVRLAHRALYESPSHRANLLRNDFGRVGIAVVDDPDGTVWVAEELATER